MSKRVCMLICVYFFTNFALMFLVGRLLYWGYFSGSADFLAKVFLEFSMTVTTEMEAQSCPYPFGP